MEKNKKWLVKIKLWVDVKGWWDSNPIKIYCDSEKEAEATREEFEDRLKASVDNCDTWVTIQDTTIFVDALKAFKIKIYSPENK